MTKSTEVATEVAMLLRARNHLLWVVSGEEVRVESHLFKAIIAAKYAIRTWDVAAGIAVGVNGKGDPETKSADVMLDKIREFSLRTANREKCVWILRDLPAWISGPIGISTLRQLRNLARDLPRTPLEAAQAIIILSPDGNVPPELAGHATVIKWPIPDRAEISALLDDAITPLEEEVKGRVLAALKKTREAAIDAAVGLTGEEAQACYAKSLVQYRRIDPAAISREKRRVIARERVLEWYDPIPGGLDAIGGLGRLKDWLIQRRLAYSPAAREYGLPAPKGIMLIGVPGCGKSLTAKAVSTAWEIPLLKMDLGALKSKFVGDSENNLRKAFEVIAAIGRCIVWFDEVEKALAGAINGGADGGVSADALGAILTWMQERRGEAFVIMTANDITGLPPEFLRKGRFDEVWFVDLPNTTERIEVLKTALKANKRDQAKINLRKVADISEGFTGAEVAELVPDAMFRAFSDGAREITTGDFTVVAESVVPLSKTAEVKIKKLRDDMKGRAQLATAPEAAVVVKQHRILDLEEN